MQLIVAVPDTVDPHMLDQLTAAIQRMGGHIVPAPEEEAAEPGMEPGMQPSPQGAVQAPMGAALQGARANRPSGLA